MLARSLPLFSIEIVSWINLPAEVLVVGSFGKELVEYASKALDIGPLELRELMTKYEPDLQTGKIDHIEFWKKLLKDKNKDVADEILKDLWLKPYIEKATVNQDVVDLITRLRKNYFVGCISNAQEPHISYNKARGLFDNFDLCLLSSEVGIRKPDKEIFELYLDKTGFSADETIFIDDEKELVTNAKGMGIHTVHFTTVPNLKIELQKLKINF